MKKRMIVWLVALILMVGMALAEGDITSKAVLNTQGMKVGVAQGSVAEQVVLEQLPEAEMVYFNDNATAFLAVAQGKVDAYVYDYNQMRIAIEGGVSGVHLLSETLGEPVQIAVGISPATKIPELENQLNRFIGELRADGTLDDMFRRWVVDGSDEMPEIALLENPEIHLTVGTSGIVPPFSYYKGTELAGYDIELARRFAAWLGADLQFKVYDYGAIIPAAASGDVDCVMANLNITPERREALTFSDILYEERLGIMVKGDAASASQPEYKQFSDLTGKTVSMLTGAPFEELVSGKVPGVGAFSSFNNMPDMVLALKSGKTDAFLINNAIASLAVNRDPELVLFPQNLQDGAFGLAFEKGDPRRDAWKAAFDAIPQEAIEAAWDKWTGADESVKALPEQDWPGANGTVRVAACDTLEPMSYMGGDGELKGFDLEVILMIARGMDVRVEFTGMEFSAILSSVQSGKADIGAGSIIITEERAQAVDFVEYYPAAFVLIVRAKQAEVASLAPSDFNGKRAGVITGSFHDSVIAEELPDSSISQYNNYTDMVAALKAEKIDYFLASTEVAGSLMEADGALTALAEPIRVLDIGAMFAKTEKGEALRAQMDAYIERIKADGTLDAIYAFWSDPANESTSVDIDGLTGENGMLRFATSGTKVPISFVANGQIAGTDPDIAVRFCREYGYGIEVNIVETAGIIPGIVTGMYDFSLSDMVITDERKESVDFSVPYHGTELLVMTRRAATDADVPVEMERASFWGGIQSSFNKTFIREGRWKLFLEGVGTTMLITLLTILFGTLLGFGVFMLCRNGNPVANLVTRFCLWLVQGMPMVVLLMILYYVIFGSVAISGITVAVIGFTLTFGAAVFGLLKMGVGAVDGGQYEAAYALGYSNRRTFFKIILPQALPHVLPAYKGEIVGLIKATAIVGYIAVQDLTKMGDIVRSRTYEAFFPLIAVTVIYFVLEGLIGFLVSRISISFNPKLRKPADILKGVKTDD